jgi:hypothetical protein
MKADSIIKVVEAVIEVVKVVVDEYNNDKEEGEKYSKK